MWDGTRAGACPRLHGHLGAPALSAGLQRSWPARGRVRRSCSVYQNERSFRDCCDPNKQCNTSQCSIYKTHMFKMSGPGPGGVAEFGSSCSPSACTHTTHKFRHTQIHVTRSSSSPLTLLHADQGPCGIALRGFRRPKRHRIGAYHFLQANSWVDLAWVEVGALLNCLTQKYKAMGCIARTGAESMVMQVHKSHLHHVFHGVCDGRKVEPGSRSDSQCNHVTLPSSLFR